MLRSAQISKKCTILGNLRTITQESKKETRQMTPFFWSTFWALMRFLMTWWKLACYENDLFTKYFRNPWKKVTKRKRKIYWGSSLEPSFSERTPLFCVPSSFWSIIKKLPPSFLQPSKLVHVTFIKHFKMKVLRFVLYKSVEKEYYHYSLYFQAQLYIYCWHLLWLDIAFNVLHIWCARGMNMKHF